MTEAISPARERCRPPWCTSCRIWAAFKVWTAPRTTTGKHCLCSYSPMTQSSRAWAIFLPGNGSKLNSTGADALFCATLRPRFWRVLHLNGRERSEEHTSELQSRGHLVCRLLLEKKKNLGNYA